MTGLLGRWVRGTTDFVRLARFFDESADPWSRLSLQVPSRAFGLACEREFSSYLDGPSRVPVASLDDICAWLRECEAVDDQTLFFQTDFWQHPVTFEHLRKGDCEDHALWAWRQMHRIGIPALFMAGVWSQIAHAWVLFERDGAPWVLEATAKSGDMLHPLVRARQAYCPALAVDAEGRTYVYQGYPRFRAAVPQPAQ